MTVETITATIAVRRDTLANFVAAHYVPANGEPIGLIDSTGKVTSYLIGDGTSTVDLLPALSKGDPGPQGPAGLPGVNAVSNDAAVASYVTSTGSQTQTALDTRYGAGSTNAVPNTRTINGYALTSDIVLAASDVGAAPTSALAAKADLVGGVVPASQLPPGDVLEFNTADSSGFPTTGVSGKIYIATTATPSPTEWRWNGTAYVELAASPGSTDAVPEGSVNKYYTDARAQAANAAALNSRLNMRGDYVSGSVYAVNDVVNSPGYGRWRCIQAHTSSGPGPNVESAYWTILGGNSNVVVGTQPGNAADAATVALKTTTINGKALSANITLTPADTGALGAGYAGAVTGTRFTVLYVSGSGWPARPTTRTDVFVDWIDTTGTAGTTTPVGIVTGDQIIQLTSSGVTTITYRSSSTVGPNQSINYLATPLQLPAPAGLAIGDYYVVAVLFGSLPFGSSFVAPTGFTRITPAGAAGQDFAVYGYKMATSADLSAVATSNWSPNASSATRGQAVGVALEGVASVGTPTAISYANPFTSPWTPASVTGDATLQVLYTGASSTSTHAVHSSVGGTLLAQVMAESGTPDPQSDNVLSVSMNGTGVSWTNTVNYGGGTNIPLTKG